GGDRAARLDDARSARGCGRGRRLAESANPRRGAGMTETRVYSLNPVTFEVLKNAFVTTVDQMAEQILRTCHSFVLYARDFSSALCDLNGDTIMQGSQDIAVHVGTPHFTAKAVIEAVTRKMRPRDVYANNDPDAGGTPLSDLRR